MSRTTRFRRGIALAAATACAAGLAACGPTQDGGAAPASSDTLRIAATGEIPSFDPAIQQSGGDLMTKWGAVYDTLLHCRQDGTVVPGAAGEFELSADATTLTMVLREGMTFADGSPVTSADAMASLERMQTGGGSDAGRVAELEIATPDERTIVLTAPRPTGQLTTFMCLAPGIVASRAQLESPTVSTRPVSSGPYELDVARSTTGSVYTFTKRDDYWDADSYDYDTIVMSIMGDVMARLNALKTGQVDAAIIQQPQVDDAAASGLHIIRNPAAWAGLYINDRDGERVPALGDVRVRRAMNMVFDRPAIADGLFAGEAQPSTQIFNPGASAYVPELDERYPYDVEAARALMAEAGYADGFTIEVPSESGLGGSATYNPMIAQQLGLLGIQVIDVPLAGPTAIGDILGGRFPVIYARIGTGDSLFDIVQSLEPGSIWNQLDTDDPELAPLLAEAQVARGDDAERVAKEISTYIVDEAWFAPWVQANSFVATSTEELVPEMDDQFNTFPKLSDFRRGGEAP